MSSSTPADGSSLQSVSLPSFFPAARCAPAEEPSTLPSTQPWSGEPCPKRRKKRQRQPASHCPGKRQSRRTPRPPLHHPAASAPEREGDAPQEAADAPEAAETVRYCASFAFFFGACGHWAGVMYSGPRPVAGAGLASPGSSSDAALLPAASTTVASDSAPGSPIGEDAGRILILILIPVVLRRSCVGITRTKLP